MLEQLREMFVGKVVRISHSDEHAHRTVEGICVAVLQQGVRDSKHFDIEVRGEGRFGFIPVEVNKDSVVSAPMHIAAGIRVIEVLGDIPIDLDTLQGEVEILHGLLRNRNLNNPEWNRALQDTMKNVRIVLDSIPI